MGLFARAASKAFDQGIGTIAVGAHIFSTGTSRSTTGLNITTDKALGYSPFWQGVRILAETFAQVPMIVYRQLPDGGKERALDHPAYRVLHDRVNPRLTSFQWRETGMGHLCTWGNWYSAVAKDGRGRLRELWPLPADRMTVRSEDNGDVFYDFLTQKGELKTLRRDEVFHVPALAWDGLVGMAPISYHRNAIGLGLATEEHGSRFFSNGANPSFVLSSPNKLSDTSIGHLRDQIKDEKTGLSNAWKPWILEEDLKPVILTMPNDDAQWLETRKHQVHETARVLNIHPYKLGSTEPGAVSYASVEQFAIDFVVTTMTPWYARTEQAAGMQLLGDDWVGAGGDYFVGFPVDGLLRGDQAARYLAYHQAITDGWMVPNEARVKEELNKLPGLDLPRIALNITTVNTDGSITKTELAPPPAP